MSSETSTNKVRLPAAAKAMAGPPKPGEGGKPDMSDPADAGLQPWQFFVLAALGCATAVTFMARGQGPTAVILLGVLMGTAALVGYAALRALRPLVLPEEDRTVMVGQRTRELAAARISLGRMEAALARIESEQRERDERDERGRETT